MAIGKLDDGWLPVAIQRLDLARDADVRTELLRLNERAVRERVPRDACRETEKVLDARARTGLAAGRATVEHRDRHALGCRVDGCRKSGGTRADDRHIVDMGGVEVG